MALSCNRCGNPMPVDVSEPCVACDNLLKAYTVVPGKDVKSEAQRKELEDTLNTIAKDLGYEHTITVERPGTGVTAETLKNWEARGVIRKVKLCDCGDRLAALEEAVAELEKYRDREIARRHRESLDVYIPEPLEDK